MQTFTQKRKPQDRTVDAASVIDCLDPNVRTLIYLLPPEDKEVFAYLITHPSEEANVELISHGRFSRTASGPTKPSLQSHFLHSTTVGIRKAGSSQRTGYHPPSFVCDCFQCYMFHWSRWNSSPNQALIHKAILLNECGSPSSSNPDHEKVGVTSVSNNSDSVDRCDKEECKGCRFSVVRANESDMQKFASIDGVSLNTEALVASVRAQEVAGNYAIKHLRDKAYSEKTSSLEAVVAEKTLQKQSPFEIRQNRQLSKEENKQKKKASKKVKATGKGNSCKQQEMHLHPSPEKVKKDIPAKYRTKQVAPLTYMKDEIVAETSCFNPDTSKLKDTPLDSKGEIPIRETQPSLTHVLSATLSFVTDRLLTSWYPRRPRGIEVF